MAPETMPMLPYTMVVGQQRLKLALELAYIAPRAGGVLISGQRGTGKSTAVRAFSMMMYGRLPVTLPINATEDRVVGGWKVDELMQGKAEPQPGLVEEAQGGMLYVDEVNLLDDHIVNLILDVTSTGLLVIQREGRREQRQVSFTLVGTMNPEEGGLRPQFMDRFGMLAEVDTETGEKERAAILKAVLLFDEAVLQTNGKARQAIEQAAEADRVLKRKLEQARLNLYDVAVTEDFARQCVAIAEGFEAVGHRADYVMALASRAHAARRGANEPGTEDLLAVAGLALQHRKPGGLEGEHGVWGQADQQRLLELLGNA